MIAEISYKNSASEELMTRKEKNTFGWRVATERDHCGLKQADVVERLATMGVKTTIVGISEIELGKRKQFQPDMIIALAKVLGVSVHYLLTGEEVGEVKSYSVEAEEVAELMDRMQPSTRQMIVQAARAAAKLEDELLETQKELIGMLYKNINLLENGDRKKVDDYLHRAGHHVGQK